MENHTEYLKLLAEKSLARLKSDEFAGYTGWMNVLSTESEEFKEINEVANKIRETSDVLVVVGIGGSYLGAKAVIEALSPKYNRPIEIIYLGNSLSALDIRETLEYLKDKDFTVNVISKSGKTLETEIAFHFLKELLIEKYSFRKAMERIIVTTSEFDGELREFVEEFHVTNFVIPEDVGGRYSVLTAVGLLPIATAGVDIEALLKGAKRQNEDDVRISNEEKAMAYAIYRNTMCSHNKTIELLVTSEPRLRDLGYWWQQLFAESEGKDGNGIFPSPTTFSTDLHSIGQLIQDGRKNLFETIISFNDVEEDLVINSPASPLKGISLHEINKGMNESANKAHNEGKVNTLNMVFDTLNAEAVGTLIQFFELSCAISCLMTGVNPFDQPGVEDYKKNMKEWAKEKSKQQ